MSTSRLFMLLILLMPLVSIAKPVPQDTLYEQIHHNMGVFGDVYREITLKYVDVVDPKTFLRAGIDGMLTTLDPYTVFIDEEGTEDLDMMTTGKYGGVGIEIGIRGKDKMLTVISAMDDSPAERVGIRNGDRIVAIDSHSTIGFTTVTAAKYLRGTPGTPVRLTIERVGSSEPIDFIVTRKEIALKDVPYAGTVEHDIGYIKLAHFSRRAADEMDEALATLKNDSIQALILDLRGNPGGLLSSAVAVLQRFCTRGDTILWVRGRSGENDQLFRMMQEPSAGNLPLAILIDGGSASASEIVAGAIQDLDRGIIIGETTFGKGLVQSVVSFETGEALKMTTAKYYTPSGRLIQKVDYFHDDDVVKNPNGKDGHFLTRNGRAVESRGGIMPDLPIAIPRPGHLGTDLWRQGMFFDFVNDYRARHPIITSEKVNDTILGEFETWLDSVKFRYEVDGQAELDTLRHIVQEIGLEDSLAVDFEHLQQLLKIRRQADFSKEEQFIRQSIESEFASSLYGPRGRIEAVIKDDPVVKTACSVLRDSKEYHRVLAVLPGTKIN